MQGTPGWAAEGCPPLRNRYMRIVPEYLTNLVDHVDLGTKEVLALLQGGKTDMTTCIWAIRRAIASGLTS